MRTYLILKEKAEQWNANKEIQTLLAEINADDGAMAPFFGKYSTKKAADLKVQFRRRPRHFPKYAPILTFFFPYTCVHHSFGFGY